MPRITVQTFDGALLDLHFSLSIPLYEQIRQWNPELFHPMFQRLVRFHELAPTIFAPMWMNDDEWPFDDNERLLLVMSAEVDVSVKVHSAEDTMWLMDVVFSPTPPPGQHALMHRFLSFWYEPRYSLSWTADEFGMYASLPELLFDHVPHLCDFPTIQRENVMQEIIRKVNSGIQT